MSNVAPSAEFTPEPWSATELPPEAPDGDLSFDCPRCRAAVSEPAYGPCSACRTDLKAMGGEQRDVAEDDYVPKMNVTPNAVALKE